MILIADSGSTKTDWRLIADDGSIQSFHSPGINPFFHTQFSVSEILSELDMGAIDKRQIAEVHFYGAGCSSEGNMALMTAGFKKVFTSAHVNIYHDLLGAARALFKTESGIVGILGTGSNACLYTDGAIVQVLGGQGYVIGDEGSGMHIGKKVVRDYMNHLMPDDIKALFESTFKMSRDDIAEAIYKKPFPNRFLASFSKFVSANIAHPYLFAMANDAIAKYMDRYIAHFPDYKSYPLRIVGSVGFHYKDILASHADRIGVKLDQVLQAPIDGLVEFHQAG